MRKIPVSGARITAVKTPHMPTATKLYSCSWITPVRLTSRAKANPAKAPMNIEGAKMPPSPPESTVSTDAITLTRITTTTRITSSAGWEGIQPSSGAEATSPSMSPVKSFSM